jgi:putative transposase
LSVTHASRFEPYAELVPRALRQPVPAGYYHVTARGIGDLFHDDHDRTWFLTLLARARWECVAYCLMTNHYHLVLRVHDATLSPQMQRLNGLYAQSFNNRHDRRGHLFEGRFRLTCIQSEKHLAEACRYVVCNPVRAGLCAHPRDWAWSSYRASAGIERAPDCLALSPLHELCGGPGGYAAYVDDVLQSQKGSDPAGV